VKGKGRRGSEEEEGKKYIRCMSSKITNNPTYHKSIYIHNSNINIIII